MRLRNILTVATGLMVLSSLLLSCKQKEDDDPSDPREHYWREYFFTFDEIPEGVVITGMENDTADYCYSFEIQNLHGPIDLRIKKENLNGGDKPKIDNLEVTGLKVTHGRSCKTHKWVFDCDYLSPTKDADGTYLFNNGVKIALIEKQGEPYLRLIIPEDCEIITNKEECKIFIKEIGAKHGGMVIGGSIWFVVLPEAAAKVKIN